MRRTWLLVPAMLPGIALALEDALRLPLDCMAEQTGGFHDYPEDEEAYEPALFHPQKFVLEENLVFMLNLSAGDDAADLYLTLRSTSAGNPEDDTELECRRVRGARDGFGFSCVNLPPSEMLLINAQTLRFTRTSVGGWTFVGASDAHNGDSIFVEYGQCVPADQGQDGGPP